MGHMAYLPSVLFNCIADRLIFAFFATFNDDPELMALHLVIMRKLLDVEEA